MNRIPVGAPIVTASQMRAAEQALFDAGVAQAGLMEAAGAAVARETVRFAIGRPVLVLAGPGNNGGDAFVAARHLRAAGLEVQVAALGAERRGVAAEMQAQWQGETVPLDTARPRPVVVDGLFGTGIARPLDAALRGRLAALRDRAEFVVAIDLPSGFDTDTGDDLESPLSADCTVALGALKPVHVLGRSTLGCGTIFLADLGIPVDTRWHAIARPKLDPVLADAHKYSRGLVVVVEGTMPGAARLAARAAMAGGAGYTLLAGSEPGGGGPDALVRRPLPGIAAFERLLDDRRIGALVLGPGLGEHPHAGDWLDRALASDHRLILDGDALGLLGDDAARRLAGRGAATWLTPHSGEFDRMFGSGPGSKIDRTRAAAAETGAVIVHKGPDTVIAAPEGEVTAGSDAPVWLSTAGTGDVLAGLLAARVARNCADPAAAAVWLHKRAAQLAGPAFHADQLIGCIPLAISECL